MAFRFPGLSPKVWLLLLFLPFIGLGLSQSQTNAADQLNSPAGGDIIFWREIPGGNCPGGDSNCNRSSPALADINNDGGLDIIMATSNGHILAVRHDGSADGALIFDVDIAQYVGMSSGSAAIASSPAVADIDADGWPEIVVGYGSDWNHNTRGGIIVLEHNGALKSGWPEESWGNNNNGLPHSVFSTPALGDLDNDGDLEIVAGGFDKRLYAYHHDSSPVAGFPADSALLDRFPLWPNLVGQLADSIWSSPALADLNDDGYLDIVIGTDEGNFDQRYGGNSGGWSCPYTLPPGWAPGYCGGSTYAFDHRGNVLPGFPKYILETVKSAPAIVDLTGDGQEEIVVGSGTFYEHHSPSNPTFGYIFSAYGRTGGSVSGWSPAKPVNGTIPGSPAVGNIAGDATPEAVIMTNNGVLYAYHANGQPVAGFPMTPRARTGLTSGFDVGFGVILGDYDNDGRQEIFLSQRESITVVDGNGNQLTTSNNGGDGKPAYATGGWLRNSPAVGDIDGDGRLELVVHDSTLYVYDLPNAGGVAEWGQFKRNAARTSRADLPGLMGPIPDSVNLFQAQSDNNIAESGLGILNTGDLPLSYTIDDSNASSRVDLSSTSGTIPGGQNRSIEIQVNNVNGLGSGWTNLGTITVNTTNSTGQPAGNQTIDLWVFKGTVHYGYAPVAFD